MGAEQGSERVVSEGIDPSDTELRMSFFEHLSELATRLKKSLIAYIIALVVVTSVPNPLHPFGPNGVFGYNFLLISLIDRAETYYVPHGYSFFATSTTDPIFAFMNVSLVVSLVVALPYIFNQIYGFVAPGLYQREKRAVRKYLLPFSLLFGIGALFGLFVVLPIVIRILLIFYAPFGLAQLIPLDSFVDLLLLIPTVTGFAFTFPVFLIPLVELRILSTKQLSSARKWVYVLVALGVGIVNPDPTFISSIPIILPIYILFEVTVYLAKRIERKRIEGELVSEA